MLSCCAILSCLKACLSCLCTLRLNWSIIIIKAKRPWILLYQFASNGEAGSGFGFYDATCFLEKKDDFCGSGVISFSLFDFIRNSMLSKSA